MEINYQLDYLSFEEINKNTTEKNVIVRLLPHQNYSNNSNFQSDCSLLSNSKVLDSLCSCIREKDSSGGKIQNWEEILKKFNKEEYDSTIWINPTGIPISCLMTCLRHWINTQTFNNCNTIGIMLPTYSCKIDKKTKGELWKSNINGWIKYRWKAHMNAIWYPSLALHDSILKEFAEKIEILKIFPLSESLSETNIDIESDLLNHIEFLDNNKVRTEGIIYIDENSPQSTFELITNSINNLPRSSTIDIIPVISPNGIPVNFFTVAIAGLITDAIFLINLDDFFSESLSNNCIILSSGD